MTLAKRYWLLTLWAGRLSEQISDLSVLERGDCFVDLERLSDVFGALRATNVGAFIKQRWISRKTATEENQTVNGY